jgi:hypothetical protein
VSTIATIGQVVTGHTWRANSEDELQAGLAAALTAAGVDVEREHRLDARNRLDLWTVDGIAIEVKTSRRTTTADVLRQVRRYAEHDEVSAVVVLSTVPSHTLLPAMIGGKPCHAYHLRGAL